MSRTSEDAVAEKLATIKPWQVLVGSFVEQSADLAVVDVGGARLSMPSVGTYFPIPNDPVRVLRTDQGPFLLGPAAPRAAGGVVTATGSPRITVEYPPGSGVTKLMGYPADVVPAVNDLVVIDWASGGTVTAVVTALPDFDEPPAPPVSTSGGTQTIVFTAIDSGNYQAGGWWTNEVWASDNNDGAWFYGSKVKDTIPGGATVSKVEIYLPSYYTFGSAPNFRTHTDGTRPAGAPSYTATVTPLSSARTGWVILPTSVGDFLKANTGGTGMKQGGFNKYRGTQTDAQSGALRITFNS